MVATFYFPKFDVHVTAEITGIAAADLVHDFLSMMLTNEPPESRRKSSIFKEKVAHSVAREEL